MPNLHEQGPEQRSDQGGWDPFKNRNIEVFSIEKIVPDLYLAPVYDPPRFVTPDIIMNSNLQNFSDQQLSTLVAIHGIKDISKSLKHTYGIDTHYISVLYELKKRGISQIQSDVGPFHRAFQRANERMKHVDVIRQQLSGRPITSHELLRTAFRHKMHVTTLVDVLQGLTLLPDPKQEGYAIWDEGVYGKAVQELYLRAKYSISDISAAYGLRRSEVDQYLYTLGVIRTPQELDLTAQHSRQALWLSKQGLLQTPVQERITLHSYIEKTIVTLVQRTMTLDQLEQSLHEAIPTTQNMDQSRLRKIIEGVYRSGQLTGRYFEVPFIPEHVRAVNEKDLFAMNALRLGILPSDINSRSQMHIKTKISEEKIWALIEQLQTFEPIGFELHEQSENFLELFGQTLNPFLLHSRLLLRMQILQTEEMNGKTEEGHAEEKYLIKKALPYIAQLREKYFYRDEMYDPLAAVEDRSPAIYENLVTNYIPALWKSDDPEGQYTAIERILQIDLPESWEFPYVRRHILKQILKMILHEFPDYHPEDIPQTYEVVGRIHEMYLTHYEYALEGNVDASVKEFFDLNGVNTVTTFLLYDTEREDQAREDWEVVKLTARLLFHGNLQMAYEKLSILKKRGVIDPQLFEPFERIGDVKSFLVPIEQFLVDENIWRQADPYDIYVSIADIYFDGYMSQAYTVLSALYKAGKLSRERWELIKNHGILRLPTSMLKEVDAQNSLWEGAPFDIYQRIAETYFQGSYQAAYQALSSLARNKDLPWDKMKAIRGIGEIKLTIQQLDILLHDNDIWVAQEDIGDNSMGKLQWYMDVATKYFKGDLSVSYDSLISCAKAGVFLPEQKALIQHCLLVGKLELSVESFYMVIEDTSVWNMTSHPLETYMAIADMYFQHNFKKTLTTLCTLNKIGLLDDDQRRLYYAYKEIGVIGSPTKLVRTILEDSFDWIDVSKDQSKEEIYINYQTIAEKYFGGSMQRAYYFFSAMNRANHLDAHKRSIWEGIRRIGQITVLKNVRDSIASDDIWANPNPVDLYMGLSEKYFHGHLKVCFMNLSALAKAGVISNEQWNRIAQIGIIHISLKDVRDSEAFQWYIRERFSTFFLTPKTIKNLSALRAKMPESHILTEAGLHPGAIIPLLLNHPTLDIHKLVSIYKEIMFQQQSTIFLFGSVEEKINHIRNIAGELSSDMMNGLLAIFQKKRFAIWVEKQLLDSDHSNIQGSQTTFSVNGRSSGINFRSDITDYQLDQFAANNGKSTEDEFLEMLTPKDELNDIVSLARQFDEELGEFLAYLFETMNIEHALRETEMDLSEVIAKWMDLAEWAQEKEIYFAADALQKLAKEL